MPGIKQKKAPALSFLGAVIGVDQKPWGETSIQHKEAWRTTALRDQLSLQSLPESKGLAAAPAHGLHRVQAEASVPAAVC